MNCNTCKPAVPSGCGKRKNDADQINSIEDLVARYWEKYEHAFDILAEFRSVTDYVCGAINPDGLPPFKYKKGPHQRRILPSVLTKVIANLAGMEKIPFASFEEIYEYVSLRRVPGFGDLCVYDCALRYGHKSGLLPDTKVYVSAGALKGAKALFKAGLLTEKPKGKYVMKHAFHPALQQLQSKHIENFLCVMHDQFKKFT